MKKAAIALQIIATITLVVVWTDYIITDNLHRCVEAIMVGALLVLINQLKEKT